jgi:hypothetical protein
MVFRLHGKAFFAWIEGRPSRNRPRFQDSIAFEPEVVMQPPRGMLLDDEEERPRARPG